MTKKIILSTFTDPKINQVLKDNLFFLAPAHQLDGQNNDAFNLGRSRCLKNNCEKNFTYDSTGLLTVSLGPRKD